MKKLKLRDGRTFEISSSTASTITYAIGLNITPFYFYSDEKIVEIDPSNDVLSISESENTIHEKYQPIGVINEKMFIRGRIIDLKNAMARYANEWYQIDPTWVEEYNRLIELYPKIKSGPILDDNGLFTTSKKADI